MPFAWDRVYGGGPRILHIQLDFVVGIGGYYYFLTKI